MAEKKRKKFVAKAGDAPGKLEAMIRGPKQDEKKTRSASEVRGKLYGKG